MINKNDNHCVEKKIVYSKNHGVNIVYHTNGKNNTILFLQDINIKKQSKKINKNLLHIFGYIKHKFSAKN